MNEIISWHKSSRCDTGSCAEVATFDDHVIVRRSIEPDGPRLVFSRNEWGTFLDGVRAGEFDPPRGATV